MKMMNGLLLSAFVVLLNVGTVSAHRINLFAYVEGGMIYTESYSSNGTPVKGGEIRVYDSREKLIMSGVTDDEGHFNFNIPVVDDLTIVINATMGHKSRFTLKRSDVEAGK